MALFNVMFKYYRIYGNNLYGICFWRNIFQIVNDVLYFLRAEEITYDRAFDVLDFLAQESDYYVWAGALGQMDWFRRRFEHLDIAHEEISVSILNYVLHFLSNSWCYP